MSMLSLILMGGSTLVAPLVWFVAKDPLCGINMDDHTMIMQKGFLDQ
jgi:hypothetical protein